MLTVDDAQARIFEKISLAPTETITLDKAFGRSLSQALKSTRNQPPANMSAMDGYAIRFSDVGDLPTILNVIGEAPAGSAFEGSLQPGQAVRIFTGGEIPDGSDTVVIEENTRMRDDQPDKVFIIEETPKGKNIRQKGLDFEEGDIIQPAGQVIRARNIALLAAANINPIPVYRKPKVALISTGNELIKAGEAVEGNQIINSNTPMLSTSLVQAGADPVDYGIIPDDLEKISNILSTAAKECDFIITVGGASVGKYDYVLKALESLDYEPGFWKVAMRPGKPLMFGMLEGKPVFGLPGNPVSAFVSSYLFVLPAIKYSMGHPQPIPDKQNAMLSEPLEDNGARQSYLRATTWVDSAGIRRVQPLKQQDSSALTSLVAANCLIVRPPHESRKQADQLVRILPL